MSERFKVQSWKGCVPKGTGGSNPPLSEKDKYYCRILSLKKTGDSNGKPRRASARKSKQDAYDSGLRRVGGANRTLATETESPSLRKRYEYYCRILSLKKNWGFQRKKTLAKCLGPMQRWLFKPCQVRKEAAVD